MKKYKLFWKSDSPFSNWYPAKFKINGIVYQNSEQYFMYQKAIGFGDLDIAKKILETNKPNECKALGRQIKNFDSEVWDNIKYDIVKDGVRAKFTQNKDLKDELLKYKGYIFAEASPYDKIYGIGFDEKDALKNIHNWGENLLGKILTELSEEII